jgi:hypothetical protein
MPWVVEVPLIDGHDCLSLLAPRAGGQGWAVVATMKRRVMGNRLGEQVAVAPSEQTKWIGIALRAALFR